MLRSSQNGRLKSSQEKAVITTYSSESQGQEYGKQKPQNKKIKPLKWVFYEGTILQSCDKDITINFITNFWPQIVAIQSSYHYLTTHQSWKQSV